MEFQPTDSTPTFINVVYDGDGGGGAEEGEEECVIYRCPVCCKVFVDKELLDLHLLEIHEQNTGSTNQFQLIHDTAATEPEPEEEEFILGLEFDDEEESASAYAVEVQVESDANANATTDKTGIGLEQDQEQIVIVRDNFRSAAADSTDQELTECNERVIFTITPADEEELKVKGCDNDNSAVHPSKTDKDTDKEKQVEQESKSELLKLIRKRFIRICLEDIGLSFRMPCEFCSKRIQLVRFQHHQQSEHEDELMLRKSRSSIRATSNPNQSLMGRPRRKRTCSSSGSGSNSTSSRSRSRSRNHSGGSINENYHKNQSMTTPQRTVGRPRKNPGSTPNTNRSTSGSKRDSGTPRVNGTFSFGSAGRGSESHVRNKPYVGKSDSRTISSSSPCGEVVELRKPYKCLYCDKSFVASSQCKSHENTHTQISSSDMPVKVEDSTETETKTPEVVLFSSGVVKEEVVKVSVEEFKYVPPIPTIESKPNLPIDCDTNSTTGLEPNVAGIKQKRVQNPERSRHLRLADTKENSPNSNSTLKPADPNPNSKLETCQTCGVQLCMPQFVTHIYSHLTKNQKECSLCQHKCYTSHDLKEHLHSKHYGLKPHICTICARAFGWSSGLRVHHESCHSTVKPFKCYHCRLRFETNRERRRHELVHKNLNGPATVNGNGLKKRNRNQRANSEAENDGARPASAHFGKRRISMDSSNSADVLKTKHNICASPLTSAAAAVSGSNNSHLMMMSKMASPEISSILDHYVFDSLEQEIELDPMMEDYSFMDTLTKAAGMAWPEARDRRPIVAFAMTSAAGENYNNPAFNNNNYSMSMANHVNVNNMDPNLLHLQHGQGQAQGQGGPGSSSQIMAGPSGVGAGAPSSNYTNANHANAIMEHAGGGVSVSASPSIEDEDGEEDEEEDDEDNEYYRDEDKRYVEPPDVRIAETCKTCSQLIPMSTLRDHIQSHVTKGQLECSICNYKAFNGKYLLDHLNIHYSLKPYQCDKCGRHFTFHGYLRSHIKQVHMKSKDRPHECRYCDKKFVRPCHRRTHERVHKGEIPKAKRTNLPAPLLTSTPTSSAAPPAAAAPPPSKAGFKTPQKHSDLLTPEMLLSSPANIQPKMTSTWPPMNPHFQDPWLNPIHSESSSPNNIHQRQQQQHHHQHQQQQNYFSPSPASSAAASAASASSGSDSSGLYYNYQSNTVVNPNPNPMYYAPQTLSFGGSGSGSAYSPNPNHLQQQRQHTPTPTPTHRTNSNPWTPGQQQQQHPQQRYNYAPSPTSSSYYYDPSTNYDYNAAAAAAAFGGGASPSPGSGMYNNYGSSSASGNLQGLPNSLLFNPAAPPSTSVYELSDFNFNQPFDSTMTMTMSMPPSTPSGAGQATAPAGYSISTPSTSTFDLWAELRDEELKLFPETSNCNTFLNPSVGDFTTFQPLPYNVVEPHTQQYGYTAQPLPPHQQQQQSTTFPTTFDLNPDPSFSQLPPISATSDPTRIKVKIKRLNGQSTLVSDHRSKLPMTMNPIPTAAAAAAAGTSSREIIPQGGRRLSSDDLDDIELTNAQCLICDHHLLAGADILEHISSHIARGQTHCVICDRSFAHSWYLKVHTYKHYGIKLYECTYCHRKFSKRHSLTAHIEQAHANDGEMVNSQVCEYCKKMYTSRFALRRHQKVVHNIVLKREVGVSGVGGSGAKSGQGKKASGTGATGVGSTAGTGTVSGNNNGIHRYKPFHLNKEDEPKELELSIKEAHLSVFLRKWTVKLENIGLQSTKCPICKEQIHIKDMLTHKTEHQEDCHICGKTVPSAELISHGSTHVSSLYCEICNWKGKQKSQIWEHMNGHLGHKPLKCEYCGVGFASRSSVRLHTIARHTNIRLHKCDFCDARFVTPQVKRMHQLQHYDTNCPFCNKYFALKKDLATHIRVHYKMAGQKLVLKDVKEELQEQEVQQESTDGF